MPVRFLHVANGSATTNLIEAAGIPGRLSIWADVLDDGPVPGGIDDAELIRVRARHLADPATASYANEERALQGWRDAIERVGTYDELVLWYEHDLFDQLNLLQLLSWIKRHLPSGAGVSLIEIGAFPGRAAFKGLGELTPTEVAPLLETRSRVSAERYATAERAWSAFRQSTPEALIALLHTDTSGAPFLHAALTRFLEEYPSTLDGLSRTERRLLTIASTGPVDLRAAFPLMHHGEAAYYITDRSFLSLLREFSERLPLIAVSGAPLQRGEIPQGTLTLTEHGRAVLDGRRDRVAAYGVDRWLGGVHLTGKQGVWRWDQTRHTVTMI